MRKKIALRSQKIENLDDRHAALQVEQAEWADLLRGINGRKAEHTYTSFHHIEDVAKEAEKALDELGLAKKHRIGARVYRQSGSRLASAYRYNAATTTICIERGDTAWYLIAAFESTLYPNSKPLMTIKLTPTQDGVLVAKLREKYDIIGAVNPDTMCA